MVHVSVSSLGYEGLSGYLLFRDDTAVFATGTPGASFVHGGNSPQERVIPVLTVTRQRAEQGGYSEYAVEVDPLPDVVGLHRLKLRVGFAKQTTTSLGFAAARAVDLALRVPNRPEIGVILKDVSGPGKLRTGRLQVPVSEAWTEIFFGLEGPADDRVRIEIHHPDSVEKVQGKIPDPWYAVSGTPAPAAKGSPSAPSLAPPPPPEGWAGTIADEGIRKVFLHLEKHGVVTETELMTLLDSRASRRRFLLEYDGLVEKLPFRVRIEPGEGGKRYVREGDR